MRIPSIHVKNAESIFARGNSYSDNLGFMTDRYKDDDSIILWL